MLAGTLKWLFCYKTGSEKRFPKIVILLMLINVGVLLIPESLWIDSGVDVMRQWDSLPGFLQYYLAEMEHKNAAYVFWIMLPFTAIANALVMIVAFNKTSFERFLNKRKYIMDNRLTMFEKNRKIPRTWRSDLFVFSIIFCALYYWGVFVHLAESSIAGNFVPEKNRLALLLFVGWMPIVVFPFMALSLALEARAVIANLLNLRRNK